MIKKEKPRMREGNRVVCGTPGYICPEVLNDGDFNLKSDVFCAGCILFSILTLKHLFSGTQYKEIMDKNKKCSFDDLENRLDGCS